VITTAGDYFSSAYVHRSTGDPEHTLSVTNLAVVAGGDNLSATDLRAGKTVDGVTGTLSAGGSGYGINGTGLLGASW
jgi:hypothetical protein